MLTALLCTLALGQGLISAAPGRGATLSSEDGRFALTVRTRFVPRVDLHLPPAAEGEPRAPETRANISTARLWVQGHAFSEDLKYLTQLAYAARDYRDGVTSPLFDAYIDWTPHRDLNVKVGQYFVPFDRLRTVREFALQMTDRPRPVSELTLDRDVGVTLYSEHLGGDRSPLAYHLGVFGGDGMHATGFTPAGALGVARLELRPLGEIDDASEGDLDNRAAPGLALGVGAAYNLNTTRLRSTTGATFAGGTADYLHLAADLVFKWRGFAVEGELLYRDAAQDRIVSTDDAGGEVVEWTRSGYGWVGQASVHLRPGVEFTGRYSHLVASEGTDPSWVEELEARDNEVAAGVNWYLNGHRFKLQTTWIALFAEDFAQADHTVVTQLDMMF